MSQYIDVMIKISSNSDEKYEKIWNIEIFIYSFEVTCIWGILLTSVHAQKLKIDYAKLWL